MSEIFSFNPENRPKAEFPHLIKNLESFEIMKEIMAEEKIAEHLEFLKKHHLPSFEHCLRVGTLSADLGFENNFDEKAIKTIATGGAIHDLGKCAIPVEILNKDSGLTEEERKIIRTHVREGFDMLSDPYFDGIREIVISHHEYRNGDSYPRSHNDRRTNNRDENKNRRKKILDDSIAIVAAADVFDALAVQRPYNPEFSFEEIKQIITNHYSGPSEYVEQILNRFKPNKKLQPAA